jgi:hypothetical protein
VVGWLRLDGGGFVMLLAEEAVTTRFWLRDRFGLRLLVFSSAEERHGDGCLSV